MNGFSLLPIAASSAALQVDRLFFALLGLTGAVALALAILVVALAIRYRAGSPADRRHPPTTGRRIEMAWTLAPLLLFLGVFAWSGYVYSGFYDAPADALRVFVLGKQWMWKFEHENGKREVGELHLPLGRPVQLVIAAQDVIHSFFVPAFRLKQDAVPGRYTTLWFTPTRLGSYRLFCAEYCGTDHAHMGGQVVVMRPAEFEQWLAAGPPQPTLAARGFQLFRALGCSGCHDPQSTVHAPSLIGLYGRRVHLQDGSTVVADEQYIRDSILLPKKQVVAGFRPIMPSFQGQVDEEQIRDLIAYIKTSGMP